MIISHFFFLCYTVFLDSRNKMSKATTSSERKRDVFKYSYSKGRDVYSYVNLKDYLFNP
jgi:hypothetical protein